LIGWLVGWLVGQSVSHVFLGLPNGFSTKILYAFVPPHPTYMFNPSELRLIFRTLI